jgi:hypothetical protein
LADLTTFARPLPALLIAAGEGVTFAVLADILYITYSEKIESSF